MNNLNCKKANGPDQLPIRVLKETAAEITPMLRVIYTISLQQGMVCKDWRLANIASTGIQEK